VYESADRHQTCGLKKNRLSASVSIPDSTNKITQIMGSKPIFILGIESSCDDTSAAVSRDAVILSNVTAGQEVHRSFGGVVPELASRAHQQNIVPVVHAALLKAGVGLHQLDAVAFTRGPGLMGSLLVGVSFAKALALSRDLPLLEVNHMQSHILAHFIEEEGKENPSFPMLCLTVSGGHTQIVLLKSMFDMEVIGETIDDAAGEAFDKAAKILGLPYPGGPLVDRYAASGNPAAYTFPHPKVPDLDFSFSGLKTSVLYFIQARTKADPEFISKHLPDLCASIQETIVSILLEKLKKASQQTGIQTIAIAGGVSANSGLRKALLREAGMMHWKLFIPKFEYCTDNAAMIAVTGYYKFQKKEFASQGISPVARYPLSTSS
jgi:N6-L-threonylcarbamoyladenine synthase